MRHTEAARNRCAYTLMLNTSEASQGGTVVVSGSKDNADERGAIKIAGLKKLFFFRPPRRMLSTREVDA